MGVATPDPTVLARSLSTIMSGVLDSNPDATFRTALVKNELKLDTKPTTSTVMAFHKHLLRSLREPRQRTSLRRSRGSKLPAPKQHRPRRRSLHQPPRARERRDLASGSRSLREDAGEVVSASSATSGEQHRRLGDASCVQVLVT